MLSAAQVGKVRSGGMGDTSAERKIGSGLAIAAVALWALVTAAKFWIASDLGLHPDEAFYWLEAQRPAWSYSEVPFLTPALVGFGTMLLGDTPLGVRIVPLIFGAALAPAVWLLAHPIVGARAALIAATFTLLIPLPAATGLFAFPDAALMLIQVLCLAAVERATRNGGPAWWITAGVLAAIGFSAHYRFAFFALGVGTYLVATRNGRVRLATPWPWIAGAISFLGLVPILIFNMQNRMAGLGFHFVDRHPWSFDPAGLWFLPEQALVVTPLIFAALAMEFFAGLRRAVAGADRDALMIAVAAASILPFALLKPWSVNDAQFTLHWPQFACVPLLVLLPATLAALRVRLGRLVGLVPISGGAAVALLLMVAGLSAHYDRLPPMLRSMATHHLSGWGALANAATVAGNDTILVADTIPAASQIAFHTGRADVYSLDVRDPRELLGRAQQMNIWSLDRNGLQSRHRGAVAVAVVRDTPQALADLCTLFGHVSTVATHDLAGRRPYRIVIGEPILPPGTPASDCH